MTFVLGTVTSGGAYLLADTKATIVDRSGIRQVISVTQRKIQVINDYVVVGASGSGKMAAHIVSALLKDRRSKKWNITTIKEDLTSGTPSYLGKIVTDRDPLIRQRVVLTFAGIDKSKKMFISRKKYADGLHSYIDFEQKNSGSTPDTCMSPLIHNALQATSDDVDLLELNSSFAAIFQLDISANGIEVIDCPFGTAAYSGSVLREDVQDEHILGVEFSRELQPLDAAFKIIPVLVNKFNETIGGCVTPLLVRDSGVYERADTLMRFNPKKGNNIEKMYETKMINGRVHLKIDSYFKPLSDLTSVLNDANFEI